MMVAIFTFKNIYRHSLGNIKTMIQIWKKVRGGFQLYLSLILSAACTAAKNVFWWRGKDFPLFLLRHICYWWAWPGFAERLDESQTPTSVTQHLLSVCLPSVRACVKHGVIKYLVWDFFFFFRAMEHFDQSPFLRDASFHFPCRTSWHPVFCFLCRQMHANTAAVFKPSFFPQ